MILALRVVWWSGILALLLPLGACWPFFNARNEPALVEIPAEGVDIPLDVHHNLPLVQVRVNGSEPLWFVVDTGSFATCIDDDVAAKIGLDHQKRLGLLTTGAGTRFGRMDQAVIDRLEIGGATYGGFYAMVKDLADLEGILDHPFHGIVGIRLINENVWTIDYPGRNLRIDAAMPELANDEYTAPFTFRGDIPAVEIRVGDATLTAEIDTGSTGALMLSEDDARRVPKVADDIPLEGLSTTLTGDVKTEYVQLDAPVFIGPTKSNRPRVEIGDTTTIGGAVLINFSFTIDGKRQLIRLRPSDDLRSVPGESK